MATAVSDHLPWLSQPSTAHDLFTRPVENPVSYPVLPTDIDDKFTSPRRVVATRGTEFFVGVGNEVRCGDLKDLKARHPKFMKSVKDGKESSKNFKILDLKNLKFDIHQLEISNDGLLLAIIGEKEVAVCVLPAEGFAKTPLGKLRVPTLKNVGISYHNMHTGSIIVRAVWHPLGVEGASLVVLTSDAFIRTYDFTTHLDLTFEIPDQTFDIFALSGQKRPTGGFMADPEEMEPASCCFGAGEQGWRPFTLYILMRGGDIYALSPIVPSRWMASRDYLQQLSLDIAASLESIDEQAALQHRLMLRHQTKWINDIMNQETNFCGSTPTRRKNATCLSRPECVGPNPQLQGPFLFQPAPLEVSTEESYACDIFHIEADPVGVIGILYSNGKVDICLEFVPLDAKWVDKSKRLRAITESIDDKAPDLPIISTYETIKLGINAGPDSYRNNWPVFTRDPQSDQLWYINHNWGVMSFSMKPWLSTLATVLDGDEDDAFLAVALEKSPRSIVKSVVDNGKQAVGTIRPILGSLSVDDAYVGYIFIAATASTVHSVEFDQPLGSKRTNIPYTSPSISLQSRTSSPVNTPAAAIEASTLMPPYTTPQEFQTPSALPAILAQEMAKNPKLLRNRIEFSAESHRILTTARDTLKVEHDSLMVAASAMYVRAEAQRLEYRRQIEMIHQIDSKLAELRARNVRERLEAYLKRNEELQKRADEALKILIVKSEKGLSDAEKKWFKEIGKMEEMTKGTHRTALAERKKGVEKMAENLLPLAMEESGDENPALEGGSRESDGVPDEVRRRGLKQLRDLLDREETLVAATRKKLESLTVQTDAL